MVSVIPVKRYRLLRRKHSVRYSGMAVDISLIPVSTIFKAVIFLHFDTVLSLMNIPDYNTARPVMITPSRPLPDIS